MIYNHAENDAQDTTHNHNTLTQASRRRQNKNICETNIARNIPDISPIAVQSIYKVIDVNPAYHPIAPSLPPRFLHYLSSVLCTLRPKTTGCVPIHGLSRTIGETEGHMWVFDPPILRSVCLTPELNVKTLLTLKGLHHGSVAGVVFPTVCYMAIIATR